MGWQKLFGKRISAMPIHGEMGSVNIVNCFTTLSCRQPFSPIPIPFDGRNHDSVVMMDNCSIYHVDETVRVTQEVGTLVLFSPTYSSDHNPIEEALSKEKLLLKSTDKEAKVYEDPESLVLSALSFITLDTTCLSIILNSCLSI